MKLSDLRRGVPAALFAGLLAIGGTACGSEVATTSEAGDESAPRASGQMQEDGEVSSTITYTRSGGFAGFSDKLVLEPDGTVTIRNKANPEPFTCKVKTETLSRLGEVSTAAAESPEPEAKGKPNFRTPMPDAMHYSLQIGERKFSTQYDIDYDKSVSDTFSMMHRVLDSASALRDGREPKGESVCTL